MIIDCQWSFFAFFSIDVRTIIRAKFWGFMEKNTPSTIEIGNHIGLYIWIEKEPVR